MSSIMSPIKSLLVREELKELAKDYDKSENDLKALQSVGQVHIRPVFHQANLFVCQIYLFLCCHRFADLVG